MSRTTTDLLYLVTIVTFILALRFLSRPDQARWGNRIGAAGMLLAIGVTFAQKSIVSYWEIALGMMIGGGFVVTDRMLEMFKRRRPERADEDDDQGPDPKP